MRKMVLLPVLMVCAVCAVGLAQGEAKVIKLCGREFIRAIVFTCGGSRWKRIHDHSVLEGVGSRRQENFELLGTSPPQHRRDLTEKLTAMCCRVGCRKSDLASFC